MLLVLDDGEFLGSPYRGNTNSIGELTSAALLKTKGCSSAVEALCGQPKSRSTS